MHPALLEQSGWKYHKRVRELKAAKWWGCPSPGYFDSLPKSERVDILAAYEISWREEAINSYEANERAKREAKRGAKPNKPGMGRRPRRRGR
jgi:hypothetical protein